MWRGVCVVKRRGGKAVEVVNEVEAVEKGMGRGRAVKNGERGGVKAERKWKRRRSKGGRGGGLMVGGGGDGGGKEDVKEVGDDGSHGGEERKKEGGEKFKRMEWKISDV